MVKPRGAFPAALVIAWIALGVVGVLYARSRGIAVSAAAPIIAAFLIETPFYLVIGFRRLRERVAGARWPGGLATWFVASAILPYLACCCGALPFNWMPLARLAAMALLLGLWYRALPPRPLSDLAFLTMTGVFIVSRYLEPVYPDFLKQHLIIIGHITVIQISVMVLLMIRRVPECGFGFWPTPAEWRSGLLHFAYFMVIAYPLNLLLNATHVVAPRPFWTAAAAFAGALWVQALSEEFFFRGVLQSWIESWTRHRTAALLITSALFGSIHYLLRGWKWVVLTFVLGFLCGRARNQTGGIRAGTVTHSLVIASWRAFFW
jgi:membrane protease YdiL (CAAX protease family)